MKKIIENRVSIIIAAYNAEETIQETLESAINQKNVDIEIIVCDDASTDSTADVVRNYRDPRILLLQNHKNLGPGPSRDRAIQHASGEWIALVDADDVIHPDRTYLMLEAAAGDKDIIIFDNHVECHHSPEGLIPWRTVRVSGEFGEKEGRSIDVDIANWLSRPRLTMHPFIPALSIQLSGIRHSKRNYAEDNEFYLSLLATGLRLRYLPAPLYFYRITPTSLSSRKSRWEGVAEIYLDSAIKFKDYPAIVLALKKKAYTAAYHAQYYQWLEKIREKKLAYAIVQAAKKPKLIKTLVKRMISDGIYLTKRIRHNVKGRR